MVSEESTQVNVLLVEIRQIAIVSLVFTTVFYCDLSDDSAWRKSIPCSRGAR